MNNEVEHSTNTHSWLEREGDHCRGSRFLERFLEQFPGQNNNGGGGESSLWAFCWKVSGLNCKINTVVPQTQKHLSLLRSLFLFQYCILHTRQNVFVHAFILSSFSYCPRHRVARESFQKPILFHPERVSHKLQLKQVNSDLNNSICSLYFYSFFSSFEIPKNSNVNIVYFSLIHSVSQK